MGQGSCRRQIVAAVEQLQHSVESIWPLDIIKLNRFAPMSGACRALLVKEQVGITRIVLRLNVAEVATYTARIVVRIHGSDCGSRPGVQITIERTFPDAEAKINRRCAFKVTKNISAYMIGQISGLGMGDRSSQRKSYNK